MNFRTPWLRMIPRMICRGPRAALRCSTLWGRLTLALVVVSLSACGMAEDEKVDAKRHTYIDFADPQFEAYCLELYDLNADGRFSVYEAERVLYVDCSGRGITSLYGIEYFVQLRQLDCSDNAILTLDLMRNEWLEQLNCSENELTLLLVDDLRLLNTLNCAHNHLQHLDLSNNGSIHTLDLSHNDLQLLDASSCSRSMYLLDCSYNPRLETLYLSEYQRVDRLYPGTAAVVWL